MKLDEMKLLIRVAESGSMTQAARQMHLTPAAVSATVRRVEDLLGVRIFDRTTRSLHLTDEGTVVVDGCQAMLARWSALLEEVQGESSELTGRVNISAPADTAVQVLRPLLAEFADSHPQLQLIVHSSDAVQELHREAIDMAIRYGALPDSGLSARRLTELPVIFVASPDYVAQHAPLESPGDLAAHRCVTLQVGGEPKRSWHIEGPGRVREVAMQSPLCGDGLMARQWAVDGVGIARKSLFDVIDDLESGRLVRVLPEHSSGDYEVHVVFPSRRHQPARVRVVDAAIREAFERRAVRCRAWLADG